MASYLTPEEAAERLQSRTNGAVRPLHRGGRSKGAAGRTEDEKATLGALAKLGPGTTPEISPSQRSLYKNGMTGHNKSSLSLKEKIEVKSEIVRDQAFDSALDALGLLTKDKMLDLKAPELADVASKMATVGQRLSGDSGVNINAAKVVVFAPNTKTEEDFDTIDVEAREIS